MKKIALIALLSIVSVCMAAPLDTCEVEDNMRFDCYPDQGASKATCTARGCCWKPASTKSQRKNKYGVPLNVPYCFYGSGSFAYEKCGTGNTTTGFFVDLCMKGKGGPYGDNVEKLRADFMMEDTSRLRVKVRELNFCSKGTKFIPKRYRDC